MVTPTHCYLPGNTECLVYKKTAHILREIVYSLIIIVHVIIICSLLDVAHCSDVVLRIYNFSVITKTFIK